MIINFEEYRRYLVDCKRAESTITNYMTQLRQFDNYMVEHGYERFCTEASEGYKKHMIKVEKKEISSVNNAITIMNTYFNYLKNEKRVRRTRKYKLKTERVQKTNSHEYLIPEEYEALYNACRHPETKVLIKLMKLTGMRVSEAVGVTYEQIEPDIITIHNKAKWRIVAIDDEFKAEIREFFGKREPTEPLFTFSKTTYRNRIKEAARLAGIPEKKAFPHAFRHYFAKEYLRNSDDERALVMLKDLLGHSDLSTTSGYLKFTNRELADSMIKKQKSD